jgi:RNA polymerase sigma-70 factor, ECF subfamily
MCVDVSDAELAAALTEGRPEAFRTAWDRFSPLVGGVLRHALGYDELEDVQQEVFASLFRRVSTLRDPLALRPFVIAITLNTVKYERRRRRRRARISLIADPAQLNSVGRDQPASNLAFGHFMRLVRQLAEREQATFVYRFIERMTVAQIASAMNISEPTARRSFSRAWARMQKWAARDPFLNDYLHGKRLDLPEDDVLHEDETEYPRLERGASLSLAGYPPLPEISIRLTAPAKGAHALDVGALAASCGA